MSGRPLQGKRERLRAYFVLVTAILQAGFRGRVKRGASKRATISPFFRRDEIVRRLSRMVALPLTLALTACVSSDRASTASVSSPTTTQDYLALFQSACIESDAIRSDARARLEDAGYSQPSALRNALLLANRQTGTNALLSNLEFPGATGRMCSLGIPFSRQPNPTEIQDIVANRAFGESARIVPTVGLPGRGIDRPTGSAVIWTQQTRDPRTGAFLLILNYEISSAALS